MLMLSMEVQKCLGLVGCLLLFCLQIVQGLTVNMLEKCRNDDSSKAITLSERDVAYVNIDGSNWWNGETCVLIFKAHDTFDDLKLKFTQYQMHDCDVKFQVYTSLTSLFFSSTDSSYSCTNAPLLNWKSTKNRYVKLKLKRYHESARDFSISLQLSVADYDSSSGISDSDSSTGLNFSVIGLVVFFIVLAIVVAIIIACCCCCSKSRRSSGTIFRQNYQAAPVAASNNNAANVPQNWVPPPPQGAMPTAPYPTLPGHGQAGSYPYPYGYPQGGAVPPAYPPPPPGYPAQQPPSYPAATQPNIEPSAPPAMMEPPPPYPGQESTPLKGF